MNNPVTAAAILEFLERNKKYFRHDEGEDIEFVASGDSEDDLFVTEKLAVLQSTIDAEVLEFDDEFTDVGLRNTLVYSVVVNR